MLFACLVAMLAGACLEDGVDADESAVTATARDRTIDPRRSLAVTEERILARFSLERVMTQLVAQSGVPGLTPVALFQQWWDTQNPGPGHGPGPYCDSFAEPGIGPAVNGYPYTCRPAPSEGAMASCDPFSSPDSPCAFIPIGLFHRFDLAPPDGAHCGEHRIVYAKRTGIASATDRVLVIFEAIQPNPHPQQGLRGCRRIVDAWADLSSIDDLDARAAALERFYFVGHGNVPPVVDVTHFGHNALGAGQIRTNQFSNLAPWTLRELKLFRSCIGARCSAMRFVPVTAKNNPFGPLFDPRRTDDAARAFRAHFATQVEALAAVTVAGISMSTPDQLNSAQSQATTSTTETMYAANLGAGPGELRSAIAASLARLGSSLTVDDIIARAQTQSCAGCHRFSSAALLGGGLRWPASLGFTHVTERQTETVGGATRFVLSPALVDVFLPHRKRILEAYLNDRPRPAAAVSLGGSTTH